MNYVKPALAAIFILALGIYSCEKKNEGILPPKITITKPIDVSQFIFGQKIPLSVEAFDADGLKDLTVTLRDTAEHLDIVHVISANVNGEQTAKIDSFFVVDSVANFGAISFILSVNAHDAKGNERAMSLKLNGVKKK